jgi:hypothetical protein
MFKIITHRVVNSFPLTFRGFASVAIPANCVLSAKIKYFREERSTIQEKPAIAQSLLLAPV